MAITKQVCLFNQQSSNRCPNHGSGGGGVEFRIFNFRALMNLKFPIFTFTFVFMEYSRATHVYINHACTMTLQHILIRLAAHILWIVRSTQLVES